MALQSIITTNRNYNTFHKVYSQCLSLYLSKYKYRSINGKKRMNTMISGQVSIPWGRKRKHYFEEIAHIETRLQAMTALKDIFSFRHG